MRFISRKSQLLTTSVFLTLFISTTAMKCEKSGKDVPLTDRKPKAMGEVAKVAILVPDETYVACKSAIKAVYQAPLDGMPGYEPHFSVNHGNERNFTDYFKHNYNLAVLYQQDLRSKYVKAIGSDLVKMLDEKLASGSDFFVVKDLFAEPQEVSFILGKDTADLRENMITKAAKIRDLAHKTEEKTTIEYVIRGKKKEDKFFNAMQRRLGYGFRTPSNFTVSVRSDEFNGVNRWFGEKRSAMYLYEETYSGDEQFTQDYIIAKRNAMVGKHIEGPDRPDSIRTYMTTDTVNVITHSKDITLNGYRAVETRGWWELANEFMGGPFVCYTIHCPDINKVVTIETNVFAPGKSKRVLLRTMELAASTFEVKK